MNKKNKPPSGIFTDYTETYTQGFGGKIDSQTAETAFDNLLNMNIKSSFDSTNKTIEFLHEQTSGRKFMTIRLALSEVLRSYPITPKNWSNGERIPGVHAEETSTSAMVLVCQGHYKSAFQKLREVIELVILQFYFLLMDDSDLVGRWGRAEIRTPGLKEMMKTLDKSQVFLKTNEEFNIRNRLYQIYDDLGAYVHTRGITSTSMGLTGSNKVNFSESALAKFLDIATPLFKQVVLLFSVFFPTCIIPLDAFRKFGYFDPVWILRKDHVSFIGSVLVKDELESLEKMAENNAWFVNLRARIDSLKDLNQTQIDSTYAMCEQLSQDIEEFQNHSKRIDEQLYVPYVGQTSV